MKKSYDDIKIDDTKYNDSYDRLDHNAVTRGISQIQIALYNTPSESHNLIVYSDIRVLRAMYPAYVKSLLEDNEIVLILTYYDHPSMVRQILDVGSKKNSHADIERYLNDGSLVIVDSLMTYFNPEHINQLNNSDNERINFLSLIRILLNHGIKNNKKGITILSDMGSFFHFRNNQNNNNGNDIIHNIIEFERSIPARYKNLELKKFCLYHQKDYELHFASKRQKAQLLDCHGRSILIFDGTNNDNKYVDNNY
ncbi:MAG TPA: hypothetical protein VH500_01480 [Nitrososphaeraceae archaeon]